MISEQSIIDQTVRSDCGAWWEMYGKIWGKDRSAGLVTPIQNFLQRLIQEVINEFERRGLPVRIVGLKPRQKGSTTYFAACDYHWMRRKPAYTTIIGGQYSQTNELWDMISTYHKNDRFDWKNTGDVTDTFATWSNGSQMKAETARDIVAGIAGTYQVLHCTEVARWSKLGVANATTVLQNILKCVPLLPDTMVILESTAEGQSGAYYEKFIGAVDAADFLSGKVEIKPGDYVRLFAPWFEFADSAIRLSEAQKNEIKRTLDADPEYEGEQMLIDTYGQTDEEGIVHLGGSVRDYDVWEQLAWRRMSIREDCGKDKAIFDRDYPHSWQDAFMKSGNQRFNKAGIANLRKNIALRAKLTGILQETSGRIVFNQTEANEAQVVIYEKPIHGRRYLLSVDPMTGATQTSGKDPDYHGVNVIREGFWDGGGRWNKAAVVAKIPPCRWDIDVLEGVVWHLARFYGDSSGCKIVVEMNMDRGLVELLKQRGADLYMREIFNTLEYKKTKAIGYKTDERTRERAIEALATALREWDTPGEGIDIWDEGVITQLENFIVKSNGRSEAAEGHHDDDVLSVAIGILLIDHATAYFLNRGGQGLPPDLAALMTSSAPGPGAYS